MSSELPRALARLSPRARQALVCAAAGAWTVLLISQSDNVPAARLLIGLTVLAGLAAASAWLSIRWQRAEAEERRRRRRPFQLDDGEVL